jgi:hypothetical protein
MWQEPSYILLSFIGVIGMICCICDFFHVLIHDDDDIIRHEHVIDVNENN